MSVTIQFLGAQGSGWIVRSTWVLCGDPHKFELILEDGHSK